MMNPCTSPLAQRVSSSGVRSPLQEPFEVVPGDEAHSGTRAPILSNGRTRRERAPTLSKYTSMPVRQQPASRLQLGLMVVEALIEPQRLSAYSHSRGRRRHRLRAPLILAICPTTDPTRRRRRPRRRLSGPGLAYRAIHVAVSPHAEHPRAYEGRASRHHPDQIAPSDRP